MTNKKRLYEGCVSFSSAFVTSFGFLKDFRERVNRRMRERERERARATPGASAVLSEGWKKASARSTSTASSVSTFYTITRERQQESACAMYGDGRRCSQHNSSKYKATFDDFFLHPFLFYFSLPLLCFPRHHLHPVLFLHRYRLPFSWHVSNFPTRKNLD